MCAGQPVGDQASVNPCDNHSAHFPWHRGGKGYRPADARVTPFRVFRVFPICQEVISNTSPKVCKKRFRLCNRGYAVSFSKELSWCLVRSGRRRASRWSGRCWLGTWGFSSSRWPPPSPSSCGASASTRDAPRPLEAKPPPASSTEAGGDAWFDPFGGLACPRVGDECSVHCVVTAGDADPIQKGRTHRPIGRVLWAERSVVNRLGE